MKLIAKNKKIGQAMLLSVVLLSTAILGTTALVGILMIYETRYAGDVVSSAQAIFAADAGIECASYKHFKDSTQFCGDSAATPPSVVTLGNGATYRTEFITVGLATVVQSVGQSRNVARAFALEF